MNDASHKTLGDNVIPENYRITFTPDMKRFRFSGEESITVRVRRPARSIRLNAHELKVHSASVSSKGIVQKARVRLNEKEKELVLSFSKSVSGSAVIQIKFTGIHNDGMYGFYRSSYRTSSGRQRYLLSTQFEPADARAAFPCFDEPDFKATFDVSMVIDSGFTAISNMPVRAQSKAGKGKKLVEFGTTPRMSTYLLYLGVGKYDISSGSVGKIRISILAVPGNKALTKLPLEYAKKFVAFYEDYFGIKYPLPKLDMLAIPDFSAGAMENWGAITYRETALLGDREKSPVTAKQRIAEVIAHELAHQWFGDLVTMKWWNDLWLNESFATFMSYKAMDAVFPEWKMNAQYFDDVVATAFSADALMTTHPISVPIRTPDEINQIFDNISYEKGGTVLHMIENYATKETFREGLHLYLKAHSYGNATKYDLWEAIDAASTKRRMGESVTKVASYWIDQPGYPVINIREDKGTLELRQRRFLLVDVPLKERQVWPIPVRYIREGEKQDKFLMMNKEGMQLGLIGESWVKLNYGQHYLYRTTYPERMLNALGERIKKLEIRGTDSWGVENDLFVMARSGKMQVADYLDFIERYCSDCDYPLDLGISQHIQWLSTMFYGTKLSERINEVSIAYHDRILDRLGWQKRPEDTNIDIMLRSAAIAGLGRAGHEATVNKAVAMFNDYVKGGKLETNLKGAVYSIAAWTGDGRRYDKFIELYKKSEMPDERQRFLQSLAIFRTDELVERTFKFAFSKDVRLQDSYVLPAILSSNPIGRYVISAWTMKNWKMLLGKYDTGTHMLERFVTNLGVASTARERDDIRRFFARKENMRGDIRMRVAQTLEKIQANINMMRENGI